MKKTVYRVVNTVLCLLLLTSCSSQRDSDSTLSTDISENNESITEVISQTDDSSAETENTKEEQGTSESLPQYISYSCSTVVEEELNSNPIDLDFASDSRHTSCTTAEIVEFYGDYVAFWDAEMQNALSILQENLDDATNDLEASQTAWETYLQDYISVATEIHIQTAGVGSEIAILNAYQELIATRQRALELIEMCMILCAEYQFLYASID